MFFLGFQSSSCDWAHHELVASSPAFCHKLYRQKEPHSPHHTVAANQVTLQVESDRAPKEAANYIFEILKKKFARWQKLNDLKLFYVVSNFL